MLNPNHPADEQLATLADGDADAHADSELAGHVASCARCTEVVSDLRLLRAALAELPDVAPSRPLRLLPPVADPEPSAVERLAGWVRRLFTPVVVAGSALALVGLVGTVGPGLSGSMAGGPASVGDELAQPGEAQVLQSGGVDSGGDEGETAAEPSARAEGPLEAASPTDLQELDEDQRSVDGRDGGQLPSRSNDSLPAERSPWPMVLFSGVAVVIGALLLRWILVPRAG